VHNDFIYLNHILDCINDIEDFVVDFTEDEFIHDKKTFNSSIRMLEIIGEATKRLSSDLKTKNNHVQWKEIAGLRGVLIHDYQGVDLPAVWRIIQNDIPTLKINIELIIKTLH
jgi:uncharacterized protein with HEPN domain